MKLILIITFCFILSGCALTLNESLLITSNSLLVLDGLQTMHIANNPQDHTEINVVLGKHPSTETTIVYFISCIVVNTLLYFFISEDIQTVWYSFLTGFETHIVAENYKKGIK